MPFEHFSPRLNPPVSSAADRSGRSTLAVRGPGPRRSGVSPCRAESPRRSSEDTEGVSIRFTTAIRNNRTLKSGCSPILAESPAPTDSPARTYGDHGPPQGSRHRTNQRQSGCGVPGRATCASALFSARSRFPTSTHPPPKLRGPDATDGGASACTMAPCGPGLGRLACRSPKTVAGDDTPIL